ncbi:MAG: HAD hydrolase-like protein [Thermodesulfobacteriota bacterium]
MENNGQEQIRHGLAPFPLWVTMPRAPHGLLTKAAREMNLDLKKCIFVGDSLKDIGAGNRAGCLTILVQTGQGKETLKKILSGKTTFKPT